MLSAGDRAPAFTLPDQNGEELRLSDLRGETVVLYFYPRADTRINSVPLATHATQGGCTGWFSFS